MADCLDSIAEMTPPPDEVIVVDGGSMDATREIAARRGAIVVLSERGRGQQIAAGVVAANADVVLVLHADSEITPETGHRVLAALNNHPQATGGAVGQRFGRDALGLCVIEYLNELRTVFLGVSFGDQGQFFRRTAIIAEGGFPKLPLMEDVELSLRLRAAGPVLYLGGGLICSDRRWGKENWFKRCATVIAMTAIYRFRRREAEQVVAALYRRYYPVPKL